MSCLFDLESSELAFFLVLSLLLPVLSSRDNYILRGSLCFYFALCARYLDIKALTS